MCRISDTFEDLLLDSLTLAAWVSYRASGATASEADRLAGEEVGKSARRVRAARKRIREDSQQYPQAAALLDSIAG